MSNNKMKGLLKGLRYISQIFENEKEPEMQIGYPTDVKHVAHIGWDGPSVSSPSWMNEFKGPQEDLSGPVDVGRDSISSLNSLSEESERKSQTGKNSPARELSEVPKANRRHSTGASSEAPAKDKSRQTRRSTRNSPARDLTESPKANESPSRNLPDLPKKTRRKKSKDSSVGGSSRSTTSRSKSQAPETYTSPFSDPGSGNVSRFKSSDDPIQTPTVNPFHDG